MSEKNEKGTGIYLQKAVNSDIRDMLELNYKIYPPEWHVSEAYVKKIINRNPEVYNVLKNTKETKGIFSLFPLEKEIYESILSGKLEEGDLAEYILKYDKPKDVYLYLISIIVDIEDVNRKKYAKHLIHGIPFELRRLIKKGINVKEIGAIAISSDGERILPKIGFKKDPKMLIANTNEYPVYRASVKDVIEAIVL